MHVRLVTRKMLVLAVVLLASFSFSSFARPTVTTGVACFYGKHYQGRKTASGAVFDMNKMTAAHPTLPFGQKVRVTNLLNNRSVVVTINDRGPFVAKRIIDLSQGAARKLDMIELGLVEVRLELLN